MFSFAQRYRRLSQFVSLISLVALLLATLPIPLPVLTVSPKTADPFPCQSRGCGCRTPEQCWTSCCCFSASQRREWAKKHGVEPPTYAVLSEASSSPKQLAINKPTQITGVVAPRPCCDKGSDTITFKVDKSCGTSCCSQKPYASNCRKAAFFDSNKDCKQPRSNRTQTECLSGGQLDIDGSVIRNVISLEAMKCRGLLADMSQLPWAIVVKPHVRIVAPEPLVEFLVGASPKWSSILDRPDIPPPKLSGLLLLLG